MYLKDLTLIRIILNSIRIITLCFLPINDGALNHTAILSKCENTNKIIIVSLDFLLFRVCINMLITFQQSFLFLNFCCCKSVLVLFSFMNVMHELGPCKCQIFKFLFMFTAKTPQHAIFTAITLKTMLAVMIFDSENFQVK